MNSLHSSASDSYLVAFLAQWRSFSPKVQLSTFTENKRRADQILGIRQQGSKDLSSFLITDRKIVSLPEKKLVATF